MADRAPVGPLDGIVVVELSLDVTHEVETVVALLRAAAVALRAMPVARTAAGEQVSRSHYADAGLRIAQEIEDEARRIEEEPPLAGRRKGAKHVGLAGVGAVDEPLAALSPCCRSLRSAFSWSAPVPLARVVHTGRGQKRRRAVTENVRYQRMHTPQRCYLMWVDDVVVGVLSLGRGGTWSAMSTSRPRFHIDGARTHHEAGMALLGKLEALG